MKVKSNTIFIPFTVMNTYDVFQTFCMFLHAVLFVHSLKIMEHRLVVMFALHLVTRVTFAYEIWASN